MESSTNAKFALGQTVMTRGFLALYDGDQAKASLVAAALLSRHAAGDWGDLDEEDKQANGDALIHGDRVLSKYTLRGQPVYLITEADRSSTTVILVEEY